MSRARGVCALVLIDDGAATTRDADVPEEIILQRLRASSEDDDGARRGCVGARRARRVGGANDERGSGDAGSRGLGSVAFVAVESE